MNGLLLEKWTGATGRLSWGVQKVFRDALTLVADEKVTLVYGADYRDGKPCLVNSVAQMLTTSGGNGIPSQHFGDVVQLFDAINRELRADGVNTDGNVSPLAAEILLHNFAPEKERPVENAVNDAMQTEAFANNVYCEPSDEDLARDWLNALQKSDPSECEVSAEEANFPVSREAK